jgi:aromatic ring-opening dioxygenase catalytic subunit (LigB family)
VSINWSKLILPRRRFLKAAGVSAITLLGGVALANGVKTLAQESTSKPSGEAGALMPTLYIPHGGGPCFFMEWTMGPRDTWDGMGAWLRQLASTMPAKPKAMLVVSAHWEEHEVTVNTAANPPLLYDYYGFPAETYEIKYAAPGAPELAERVQELLGNAGIKSRSDSGRGLDHGVFVPLKLVYPEADIPIVQLSLKSGLDPAKHIELGRALGPLRSEGVLIVGSGMSYHNLSRFGSNGAPDSIAFDNWLNEAVCHNDQAERNQRLTAWAKAPAARGAHPREEHLIPLMVAAGAAGSEAGKRIYNERVMGMAISGFQFG